MYPFLVRSLYRQRSSPHTWIGGTNISRGELLFHVKFEIFVPGGTYISGVQILRDSTNASELMSWHKSPCESQNYGLLSHIAMRLSILGQQACRAFYFKDLTLETHWPAIGNMLVKVKELCTQWTEIVQSPDGALTFVSIGMMPVQWWLTFRTRPGYLHVNHFSPSAHADVHVWSAEKWPGLNL